MDALGLRELNRLVGRHIEAFGTREDFKILLEIAAGQQQGNPPTLKQLLLDVSVPQSTLKRRLSRLVRMRFVIKRMTSNDRRVQCYSSRHSIFIQWLAHGRNDQTCPTVHRRN